METKKRPCTVTVEKNRLRISASAGETLGERAGILVCGQICALINDPAGPLSLCRDLKVSDRKNIACGTLCAFLRDRYRAQAGRPLVLPAWRDRNGVLLFGRADVAHPEYPAGFHAVAIPVEEYLSCPAVVKGHTLRLSRLSGLEGALNLSVREGVLCMESDPLGCLQVVTKSGSPCIQSRELAAYISDLYPNLSRLSGWRSGGRLYLAPSPRPEGWDCPGYTPLHMAPKSDVTVRLGHNDLLCFSEAAVAGMGERVELWDYGNVVAVSPAPGARDGYRLYRRADKRYACIHRSTLARHIRMTQQGAKTLYALREGDRLYFSCRELKARNLPPDAQGRRLAPVGGAPAAQQ